MKIRKNIMPIFAVLTVLIFISGTAQISFAEKTNDNGFADFDGDGIDDNIEDGDGDGIPDSADPDAEPESEEAADNLSGGMINFSGSLSAAGIHDDLSDLMDNSEKFGERSFCTRGITKNRCGFDSDDFGAGAGVGIGGSSGGGGCAGGVCK